MKAIVTLRKNGQTTRATCKPALLARTIEVWLALGFEIVSIAD